MSLDTVLAVHDEYQANTRVFDLHGYIQITGKLNCQIIHREGGALETVKVFKPRSLSGYQCTNGVKCTNGVRLNVIKLPD